MICLLVITTWLQQGSKTLKKRSNDLHLSVYKLSTLVLQPAYKEYSRPVL
jgi:hypothetical protein